MSDLQVQAPETTTLFEFRAEDQRPVFELGIDGTFVLHEPWSKEDAAKHFVEAVNKMLELYQGNMVSDLGQQLHNAKARIAAIQDLVDVQADDEALWAEAQTAPESYIQTELRKLHATIEGEEPACSKKVTPTEGRSDFLDSVFSDECTRRSSPRRAGPARRPPPAVAPEHVSERTASEENQPNVGSS